tara:strand:+ start:900 stop:1034 length:135 start_codon:yes stop_codon:yes gene_type:complete
VAKNKRRHKGFLRWRGKNYLPYMGGLRACHHLHLFRELDEKMIN